MKHYVTGSPRLRLGTVAAASTLALPAFAADPPRESAAPPPDIVAPPPGTTAPPVAPTPPSSAAAATPAEDDEAGPAFKSLHTNVWFRIGSRLQNPVHGETMDKVTSDGQVEIHFGGQVHKYIGWTANLAAVYSPAAFGSDPPGKGEIQGTASILDAIAQIDANDAVHLWAGRMLVPSDRSNFSGTWFASPWYYPGVFTPYGAPSTGPRQGPYGRNDGATLWGQFAGGALKYYAGAFNLYDGSTEPLFSGRLNLALINPEPGYYHSSTYYGDKDIIALAIGGQFQADGSSTATTRSDYREVNADLLVEKSVPSVGVFTLEGAAYKYKGESEAFDYSYYALVSYLTPTKVGVGRLQPLLRVQQAKPNGADVWSLVEPQLGYVLDGYSARFALGYQRLDAGTAKGNALFLGVQIQK